MRNLVLVLTAIAILLLANYSIYGREQILASGRPVLLELAPVDPRSLMQGDYLALRFRLDEAFRAEKPKGLHDGTLVLALDPRGVATFRRFGTSVQGSDEVLLRYRIRNDKPKFASNAFFFQEKQGHLYDGARYGEFRVAADGEALLVALRGAELQLLGPAQIKK